MAAQVINCLRDGNIVPYVPTPIVEELLTKYQQWLVESGYDLAQIIAHRGTISELQTIAEEGYPLFPVELLSETVNILRSPSLTHLPALHQAAVDGNLEMVRELVRLGTPVDLPSFFNHTAFTSAVIYGQIEIMKELVRLGSSISNSPDLKHPIIYACESCKIETIEFFLELDPSAITVTDSIGYTVFHLIFLSRFRIDPRPIPIQDRVASLELLHRYAPTLIDVSNQRGTSPMLMGIYIAPGRIGNDSSTIIILQTFLRLGSKVLEMESNYHRSCLDEAISNLFSACHVEHPTAETPLNTECCEVVTFLRAIGATESKLFDSTTGLIRDPILFRNALMGDAFDSTEDELNLYQAKIQDFLLEPISDQTILNYRFATFFEESLTNRFLRILK